ncbi:ABC transporter ATP-binding protein [Arundinibacter roseus]|uniref:ABC transporter ATP-binding protein n=1 Tax=Arundinibacter roseus TaxID=2070510 RepID=A0A4V2X9E3_9BACT|nr:ABC transporter ATP-binding protein [Arundinibacter roseus]TDB63465.1 ABC transporter ATP-binding protein [Arundinibacter roseus]
MSDTVIRVENISKLYQLGEISTGTLSRDLHRWWAGVRGKEDPFRKIGQTNDRSTKGSSDYVWALQDISFDVKQGEILGIIGRNGAGKSTLLKLLSRVTKPTSGRIRVKGRMASLLEVGTGFHPELTGRENIFLNGAIMGMKKNEIRAKLDEIVDFAGVERYLDTPVKRYSSGMYVRLAFAVAAHLEPEILVIDEVLAVGDAEFQKKCLGKMKDVSEKDGRTVLFVSHNMDAIQKLCSRGMLLNNGQLHQQGELSKVLDTYLSINKSAGASFLFQPPANLEECPGYVIRVTIEDLAGTLLPEIPLWDPWQVRIRFKVQKTIPHFVAGMGINTSLGMPLQTTWSKPQDIRAGEYEIIFQNTDLAYAPGIYYLDIGLSSYLRTFQYISQTVALHISDVPSPQQTASIINTKSGLLLNQLETLCTQVK